MFQFLRDKFHSAQLQARYQRLMHERLVQFTESTQHVVDEDTAGWEPVGSATGHVSSCDSGVLRDKVRQLVRSSPHGCQILRLLEAYVTGPGLQLTHRSFSKETTSIADADRLWQGFLVANAGHYSFREHARRTWRDGECFIRKYAQGAWPPQLRFIDPELIAPTPKYPDSEGIVTAEHDAEQPLFYLRHVPNHPQLAEEIPANDVLQTRIGVDANEKRGVSLFAPILDPLSRFEKWLDTELVARKLQSSIVLWRKVQGSPQSLEQLTESSNRREKFSPGTILTTNNATEIQFLQPNTNFGDAVSLGRMLLLNVAAGAGLPEFMLTSDAANANFSSTMVAEGPAVKFFQSEQTFFAGEFTRLWRWVMEDAISRGLLPTDFFDHVEPHWSFPQVVSRDRAQERLADVKLVEAGVLSRAEVARRDGVSPALMQSERTQET